MRRRASAGVFSNPVLVGAVTVLVTTVATFLAYNANKGLPFVPTKQINIELPNGAALLPGNEVREGGYRIGVVTDMKPVPLRNGEVGAVAVLKIDKQESEIPVDSRVDIRPRSVLGLKYVEVERGTSKQVMRDGDTLPITQAHIPNELDQFYGIFDEDTREGARKNLRGFGDAFTLRGANLNRTIEDAPRFLRALQPVMTALAAPETRFENFFKELGDFTRVIAPVAERYSHGFTAGANTFEAWSRDPEALKATIEKSAPTLDSSISSLRAQRPFLVELERFSFALRDTAAELPRTLPRVIPALDAGIPVLKRSPEVNEKLQGVLTSVRDLAGDPGTGRALRGLVTTVGTLNPAVRFLGPYITVCNYFNYSWTNVAEHLSEPDMTGGAQRTLLNQAGRQDNSVTSLGATEPANAKNVQSGTPQHLHTNNYTAAIDDQGNADCESGQRGYAEKISHYWPEEWDIVTDPRIPGNQGKTFTGRDRVPEGQTFSRRPEIGPAFPTELELP
jgi:ABC-type transporter Mla subunit MlaD